MELSLIKECIREKRCSFYDKADSWEDAVRMSVQTLVDSGCVTAPYADETIAMVKKHGPYICLCPHVCIPHAMAPDMVCQPAIGFMKLNTPVSFSDDPNEFADLFFPLSSPDRTTHLELLKMLSDLIDDEETIEALLNVKCEKDLLKLLDEVG